MVEFGHRADTGSPAAIRIGVVGAGMMGAAIAYTCARAGADVVLVARSSAGARSSKAYAEHREARSLAEGDTTDAESETLLRRIVFGSNTADLVGAALVIEAVPENVGIKQAVLHHVEAAIDPGTVLASTTSTLPITTLAAGLTRPQDFVGMHFFSPAERMPLLEIVTGAKTSPITLDAVLAYAEYLGKTPIVVRDSRGFFTSRVMERYLDEALTAVGEGIDPAVVEHAADEAGYPVPPLRLLDEISLTLNREVRRETRAAVEGEGGTWSWHRADAVLDRMIDDCGRGGRAAGRGFYDYDPGGVRTGLWPGLRDIFGSDHVRIPAEDMQDRLLFVEALEAMRCLDEGVVRSAADANIGSVLGIGFPARTGGVIRFVDGYSGGRDGFADRARTLAGRYGNRFYLPAALTTPGTVLSRAQSSETTHESEYS